MKNVDEQTKLISLPFGVTIEVPIDLSEKECQDIALEMMEYLSKENHQEDK